MPVAWVPYQASGSREDIKEFEGAFFRRRHKSSGSSGTHASSPSYFIGGVIATPPPLPPFPAHLLRAHPPPPRTPTGPSLWHSCHALPAMGGQLPGPPWAARDHSHPCPLTVTAHPLMSLCAACFAHHSPISRNASSQASGWSGSHNFAVGCNLNGNTEGRSSRGDVAALSTCFENPRSMVVSNAQFYWVAAAQASARGKFQFFQKSFGLGLTYSFWPATLVRAL